MNDYTKEIAQPKYNVQKIRNKINKQNIQKIKEIIQLYLSKFIKQITKYYIFIKPKIISYFLSTKINILNFYKNTIKGRNKFTKNNKKRNPARERIQSTPSRMVTRNSQKNAKPIKLNKFLTRNKIIAFVSMFIIFLFGFGFYLYQYAPNIRVYAEMQDIKVTKQQDITANFDDNSTGITAFKKVQPETASDSIQVTGTGKTGTKSTGSVRATYLQASGTITIKAGTIISCMSPDTCNGKTLTYSTISDQTFSLSTSPVDIKVQATDIGADYNIPSGIKFSVQGVSSQDISVANVSPFSGGDSKDTQIVSQSDYDNLKSRLSSTLKNDASQTVLSTLGPNMTVLNDKTKFEITNITADKKVGDPTDTLNMNITATITVYGYDKTTVQPVVDQLLKTEEKDNLVLDLNSVQVQDTVKSSTDKNIVITLNASGILKPQVDKDIVIKKIEGKSLDTIKNTLGNIPNIKNVTYVYNPSWAPGFLKHIPNSNSQINLDLKEVNPIS